MPEAPAGWPNVPVHIETFVHPHIPSHTPQVRRLFVLCEGNGETIRGHLARTPFDYVDNRVLIEIAHYGGRRYEAAPDDTWPFMDFGITVPARFGDISGGYILYEYEDQDYAIFAGRELWGYPKTWGEVALEGEGTTPSGSVRKGGKQILQIRGDRSRPLRALAGAAFGPHLLVHTVPNPDGPGIFSQRILLRDTSPGYVVHRQDLFEAQVALASVRLNDLAGLGPLKVLGGGYQIAESRMAGDHGWARVLETVV